MESEFSWMPKMIGLLLINKGINDVTVLQCRSAALRGGAAGYALCKANAETVLNPVKERCDK